MKWGIIGTGNMGKVLLHALVTSGAVEENDMYVQNRTLLKAYDLKKVYSNIHVVQTLDAITNTCDIIFLCAKPKDIIKVAHQIKPNLNKNQCVISITSSVSVELLEEQLPCQVARVIPSITNQVHQGATLITFGENMKEENKHLILQTCKLFSKPFLVEEEHVRVASDLVSCGPAFMSFFIEKLIDGANEYTSLERDQATELITTMVQGYGSLLQGDHFDLQTLQKKVMVQGGITGEGMIVFEKLFSSGFQGVFHATHEKFALEKKNMHHYLKQLDTEI
ncbi:late competence protein ComER [Halalkalibacillus halophilus]|uniref:late competence protein ComER n=1 Tax=Halalkalibacillus halophilus TaxID=392827 RepID=UPI00040BA20B|nr:late competence protein ComER [Halalkalibacillus halophilus]